MIFVSEFITKIGTREQWQLGFWAPGMSKHDGGA